MRNHDTACLGRLPQQYPTSVDAVLRTTDRGSRPGKRDERAKERSAQIDGTSETRAERTLIFTEDGQLIRGQCEKLTAHSARILHTTTSTGQRDEEHCRTPTNTIHHRPTNLPRNRSSTREWRELPVELHSPRNHRFNRSVTSDTAQLICRQRRIGPTHSLVERMALPLNSQEGKVRQQ